jgi:hypothetical protein
MPTPALQHLTPPCGRISHHFDCSCRQTPNWLKQTDIITELLVTSISRRMFRVKCFLRVLLVYKIAVMLHRHFLCVKGFFGDGGNTSAVQSRRGEVTGKSWENWGWLSREFYIFFALYLQEVRQIVSVYPVLSSEIVYWVDIEKILYSEWEKICNKICRANLILECAEISLSIF